MCSWSIERQALKFYTREVFERFRKFVQASTKFYPLRAEVEGLSFDLVPNQGLDMRTYRVEVVVEDGLYTCGCNSFEMCGLICAHIIRVMVHMNVQQIPDKYMLHRWSSAATTPAPDPGTNGIRFGVPATNTLKYNSLCRKMNDLASDACFADDTYAVVSGMINEAKKVVAQMRIARNQVQQEGEDNVEAPTEQQQHQQPVTQEDQQPVADEEQQPVAEDAAPATRNLRNPERRKPKGRPSEAEKRRKPLVELRADANKKRQKKNTEPKKKKEAVKRKSRVKKCPYCNEEGHTVQECKYMKAAMAMDANEAAELELRL